MATRGAKKGKRSKKAAARPAAARPATKPARAAKAASTKPAGAGKLRELIGEIIEAQNRGDPQQRDAAVRALEKFAASGPSEVRQRAVEAQMAAGNAHPQDSSRLLDEIVQRLGTEAPGR